MFDKVGFREFFFREIGESQNTFNTYNSYLGRLDIIVGGLDERIRDSGAHQLMEWAATATDEPLASHRSQCRSVLRAYLRFCESGASESIVSEESSEYVVPAETAATAFRYERELQAAVRSQIASLEPGITIEDGGYEASFPSGRPDILARDANNQAMVIELKAGPCPKGAIEQVLGYAHDWLDEGEPVVRSVLIASSFSGRQKAAATLVPSLELKTYRLAVTIENA